MEVLSNFIKIVNPQQLGYHVLCIEIYVDLVSTVLYPLINIHLLADGFETWCKGGKPQQFLSRGT